MNNLTVGIFKRPPFKDIILLSVKGSINATTAPKFERKFRSALLDNKLRLVVGLRGVHYICTAGWVIFLNEINGIRNRGGDLVLAGMKPGVLDVFRRLEFDSIFKFFPNVESAVKRGFKTPTAGKNTDFNL